MLQAYPDTGQDAAALVAGWPPLTHHQLDRLAAIVGDQQQDAA